MLNSVIFWKLLDIFILIIEWISLYILINDLSIKKVSKNLKCTLCQGQFKKRYF